MWSCFPLAKKFPKYVDVDSRPESRSRIYERKQPPKYYYGYGHRRVHVTHNLLSLLLLSLLPLLLLKLAKSQPNPLSPPLPLSPTPTPTSSSTSSREREDKKQGTSEEQSGVKKEARRESEEEEEEEDARRRVKDAGGGQLHHLPGVDPGAGRRHLAGVAGQLHRLHPLPAVAHHHHRPRRHGRLPHGLRRRLLPPDLAPPHLPLRHVLHRRRAALLHRLRLRRHRPRGGPGGHEPPLPRVPALRLQRLAPEPRRRPGVLGHHQRLPPRRPRLRLHEASRPRPQHRHARPRAPQHVLRPRPLPDSVRMLQATNIVRVHLQQRDVLEREPRRPHCGDRPRLPQVEQRPADALLPVRLMQGRRPGRHQEELAQGGHHQHCRADHPRHRLRRWLCRLPQRQEG